MKLLLSLQKAKWCSCLPRYGHLKEECASELGELSLSIKSSPVLRLCASVPGVVRFSVKELRSHMPCSQKKKAKAHVYTRHHTCTQTQGSLAPGDFIYVPKPELRTQAITFPEDTFRRGRNSHFPLCAWKNHLLSSLTSPLPLARWEMLPCILPPVSQG